jgi:hypothetical protein
MMKEDRWECLCDGDNGVIVSHSTVISYWVISHGVHLWCGWHAGYTPVMVWNICWGTHQLCYTECHSWCGIYVGGLISWAIQSVIHGVEYMLEDSSVVLYRVSFKVWNLQWRILQLCYTECHSWCGIYVGGLISCTIQSVMHGMEYMLEDSSVVLYRVSCMVFKRAQLCIKVTILTASSLSAKTCITRINFIFLIHCLV